MTEISKTTVPSLTQALKDLKETEEQHEAIVGKCKNLTDEVEKLQLRIQSHLATTRHCLKKVTYFQVCLTETFSELQNVLISVNKADIMDCSISEKIKQAEEALKKVNVPSPVLDVKLEQKPKTNKEDLLVKRQEFEQAILNNTATMKDVLKALSQ